MFIVLGQGSAEAEAMMSALAAAPAARGRAWHISRFDTSLAKLIYASSDFLLVPSIYEPCGLTDFHAQILGTIPVVHRVGGLAKVRDGETGFSYVGDTAEALVGAIDRSLRSFREDADSLDRIRRTAFREIFTLHTWDRVLAEGYMRLYWAARTGEEWTGR
jgi:starch synthase